MHSKKYLLALIMTSLVVFSAYASGSENIRTNVPTPVASIKVVPVMEQEEKWVTSERRNVIAVPVGVQYRGDSGKLNAEIDVIDRIAPQFGLFMEFMDEEIGALYPAGRFEIGAAFYPLFPSTWQNCGTKLMTDISLGMKVVVHERPRAFDGRLDLYMGVGFEFSLFNPRSDQNEVQGAFGHEMGQLGIFDQGGGLNAMGGIGFDVAKNANGKWTLFLEGELRTLMPLHIYLKAQTGIKYVF